MEISPLPVAALLFMVQQHLVALKHSLINLIMLFLRADWRSIMKQLGLVAAHHSIAHQSLKLMELFLGLSRMVVLLVQIHPHLEGGRNWESFSRKALEKMAMLQ